MTYQNTHILPHMDYCSIIWGSSPLVHSILLAQKKAARIILDIKDTMYPSREMFSKLKWMPITDRIKYCKAVMVFKSINNLPPRYMSHMFKIISETHCRLTTASKKQDWYSPGGKHKVLYTYSFAYFGAIIWNNLSLSIHNCSNLNQFKSTYLNHYFS